MEEFALDSLVMRLLDAGATMGFDDPKALGIRGLQILAVLAVMVIFKKTWGGYRKNFKFSSEPLYWGSKDLAAKGGWAGMFLLPVAAIETALLPLTTAVGCFTKRSDKEKEEFEEKTRDTVRVLKRTERKAKKLEDRVGSLELHSRDVAEAIEELHLNCKKIFATVKTAKTKIAKLEKENEELRQGVAQRSRSTVKAGRVSAPSWASDLKDLDV